jgi:DNA-binding CsgD family transcriptional regulator
MLDMRGYSRSSKKDVFNIRNRVEEKLALLLIDADHQDGYAYADLIRDETNLEDEILTRIDFQTKRERLSEQEDRILQMRLDGYNVRDMVRLTGRGKGFVKTTLRNVLLKMKN